MPSNNGQLFSFVFWWALSYSTRLSPVWSVGQRHPSWKKALILLGIFLKVSNTPPIAVVCNWGVHRRPHLSAFIVAKFDNLLFYLHSTCTVSWLYCTALMREKGRGESKTFLLNEHASCNECRIYLNLQDANFGPKKLCLVFKRGIFEIWEAYSTVRTMQTLIYAHSRCQICCVFGLNQSLDC